MSVVHCATKCLRVLQWDITTRHCYFIARSLRLGGPGTCWQGATGIYFPFLSPFCKAEGRAEPSHCHCLMFSHLTITHFHVTWKGLATRPELKSLLVKGRSLKIRSLRARFSFCFVLIFMHVILLQQTQWYCLVCVISGYGCRVFVRGTETASGCGQMRRVSPDGQEDWAMIVGSGSPKLNFEDWAGLCLLYARL